MAFVLGDPRAGRPKGSQNKTTNEVRDAARAIVDDPVYREALKLRVIAGTAPHMETLLFHYAYGKPRDVLSLEGTNGEPLVFSLNLTKPREDV
jgi:hypothetical protein